MTDPLVRCWTEEQMAPWAFCGLKRADVEKALESLNGSTRSIFLLRIQDGTVSIVPKSGMSERTSDGAVHPLVERASHFRDLLAGAVATHGAGRALVIGIDVEDGAGDNRETPIFSFQKIRGGRNLLLPGVEFMMYDFYEKAPFDELAFADKKTSAVFAGSTTGAGQITLPIAQEASAPRLRAEKYFRDWEDVDFRLTQIVQCESPEVEAYLRDQGFGKGRVSWDETFRHKFIISMDGNGAACSRPAIALRSKSALIKYNSDNVLFYSGTLLPWLQYIPVQQDDDVLRIVKQERYEPGRFAFVAEAGRVFAMRYLGRKMIYAYVASLLAAYDALQF